MSSYVPKLGSLAADDARRDAVHVAVAPVVAGELCEPGQHVGLDDGKAYWSLPEGRHIGVVDPFLREPVARGQRFWLFLYPDTITSLRHVWAHPAFRPLAPSREQT